MPGGGKKKEIKKAEAPKAPKKKADPLFPARPRNFRIGGDIRVRTFDVDLLT
jgi:hypothetical protein